jgi:hypothetical protein
LFVIIGLGAAAAEMIYALSSIHLGYRGTSFTRYLENRDCTVPDSNFGQGTVYILSHPRRMSRKFLAYGHTRFPVISKHNTIILLFHYRLRNLVHDSATPDDLTIITPRSRVAAENTVVILTGKSGLLLWRKKINHRFPKTTQQNPIVNLLM